MDVFSCMRTAAERFQIFILGRKRHSDDRERFIQSFSSEFLTPFGCARGSVWKYESG